MERRQLRFLGAVLAAGVGLAACAGNGDAQQAGSAGSDPAARGLDYAREACASCHAVEPGQWSSPSPAAPSFESLAGRPDMTRLALSALLRSPHQDMPALIVAPERVDDLAAYLLVLGSDG